MEPARLASDVPQSQKDSSQLNGSTTSDAAAPPDTQVNPWAPDDGRYVTLEEYWARWYENPYPDIDVSYEWNNGILEAKPLANKPQLDLGNWFLDLLRRYLETHEVAELINMETGFFMTMADSQEPSGTRRAVRKPDIGIILNSNPVSWGRIDQRSFAGVCDAVVEFLSDSTPIEVRRDTEEKTRDYALAGVKEYTILDPSGEHMHFYRLTPQARYEEIQPDAEELIHSEVLPGFQFRIGDLRKLPGLAKLALDDVYAEYVIPDLKVAVNNVEEAKTQIEKEAQRADAEAQRADAEAQRADVENAARQQSEARVQELEAELARLRRRSS